MSHTRADETSAVSISAAGTFFSGSGVRPILSEMLDLARQALGVPSACIVLFEADGGVSTLAATGVPVSVAVRDALSRRVESAETLIAGPIGEAEAPDDDLWGAGVPLRIRDDAVGGVLGVFSTAPHAFSEADQTVLRRFGAVVEERLQAAVALRETEGRWQRLVEQHPAPLIISVDGEIRYINPAGAAMLGSDAPASLVGVSLGEFVADLQGDDKVERDAILEQGGAGMPHEYDIVRLDGERRRIEAFSIPVLYDGDPAAQTVWRDVTEQRAHEEALVRAKERAEEMDRLKTTFLMNMSHEIRTPLTTILGFSEVLTEEGDAEERELARYIQDSGERLLITLNTLLDLAQIESRTLTLAPERIDVVEQVLRVLYLFKRKAEKLGLALHLSVPTGRTVYARLDPMAFQRVLTNLLSNGIKFTQEGNVTVDVEVDDLDLLVHVKDTGIGISTAFLERSFEAFEQESRGVARSYEGSGVGLTVTKRLVDLMGGRIQVHSEKGTGSRFSVRFPGVVMPSSGSSSAASEATEAT